MVELATAAGLNTAYFENQIFMNTVQTQRAQLEPQQRAMGPFVLTRSAEEHGGPHEPWFWDPTKQGGGVLCDMGCHSIAVGWYALTPLGKPPTFLEPISISADCALLKWGLPEWQRKLLDTHGVDYGRTPAEDFATGVVTYRNPETGQHVKSQFTDSWMFEKQGLLFDLGDLHALEPRKILKLSDIFVSHTHLDHFIGFDQILRVMIGREKRVRLYGPAGFLDRAAHKLSGYSWNLVGRYASELVFEVMEVESSSRARKAEFRLGDAFRQEADQAVPIPEGVILDDGIFKARTAVLDHRIPCLAFAIEEKAHVNVWKNRLDQLGLPTGPWLRELKQAVLRGEPDDFPFRAWWREAGELRERIIPVGQLKEEILKIVPGQKIGYVVDALFNEHNRQRIVDLVRGADILFIEAAFARDEAERAAERYHLTTVQAGKLARLAGVERLEPFHFSPRYAGEEERLRDEVERAFRGLGS